MKKKFFWKVWTVLCLGIAVLCLGVTSCKRVEQDKKADEYEKLAQSSGESVRNTVEGSLADTTDKSNTTGKNDSASGNTGEGSADNNKETTLLEKDYQFISDEKIPFEPQVIDFDKLCSETNSDIYAWITIPDTKIDYPIVQHATSNEYYLNYNLDGSKGYPGCIYTENYNSKDFSDFQTVIYGHNMKNGSMFAHLHKFEDAKFFEEHPYVFIYTPDRLLVYKIFASYEYSNDHLLFQYDLSTENGRK